MKLKNDVENKIENFSWTMTRDDKVKNMWIEKYW